MKNRTIEVSVLKTLSNINVFDDNIIPIIEVIQEKTRSNMKKNFFEELEESLAQTENFKIIVDIYKSTKLRSTTDSIREYLTKVNRQENFGINELLKLKHLNKRIIPTISYLPDSYNIIRLSKDTTTLRDNYPHLAFRFKAQEFDSVFNKLKSYITASDFVILDIEAAPHTSPVFKHLYQTIAKFRENINFKSIIVNANRPNTLFNVHMVDKEPIAEIDNSLREMYNLSVMKKFDGFGDYACINASLPSTGGTISPAGIYYSYENNFFIAFKGRQPLLSEFSDYIAPSIIQSNYWKEFNETHHKNCPGCKEIHDIAIGTKNGKNQGLWKAITMLHYIYTMREKQP